MHSRNLNNIVSGLILLTLTGCASSPHNDVLIFGTETTLALDVGASAASGGSPEITVGYKRKEAVWMPLLANAKDAKATPPAGQLYKGKGDKPNNEDAYSVFASFGAQLEGKAGGAKVGLAQFFATGIAAQKLASNPASVLALTVKSDVQGAADADAVAAVAGDSAGTALGKKILEDELTEVDKVLECMSRKGWQYYLISDANMPPAWDSKRISNYKVFLPKIKTQSDLIRFYTNFQGTKDQMAAKTAPCPA